MESAICGRISPSPSHFFSPPKPGDKFSLYKRPYVSPGTRTVVSAAAPGKGAGLLETPTPTIPSRSPNYNVSKSRKSAPPYRVILHNDNYNKQEYVVRVLMSNIPEMTIDSAINIMKQAHSYGLAVVIVCDQADAEHHCQRLRDNGLHSSIEPGSCDYCL